MNMKMRTQPKNTGSLLGNKDFKLSVGVAEHLSVNIQEGFGLCFFIAFMCASHFNLPQ